MLQTATKGEIFVLDDDATARETLSVALQEEGYDVICFLDGASLLSAARACVPACNPNKLPVQFSGCESLTRREQEVLTLVATGTSNKEAARQLRLSTRTIEDHRAKIMKKVGVRNAAELIRRIYGEGRTA